MKKDVCQLKDKAFDNTTNSGRANDVGINKIEDVLFELPDGNHIEIGGERFLVPEVLFNPALAGLEYPGFPEFLESCLSKLNFDLKRVLYDNIILSGGNTMLEGFAERISNEMELLISEKIKMRILAPDVDRKLQVWKGAAAVSNLNSFRSLWITRKEYQEEGERIFLMKSF